MAKKKRRTDNTLLTSIYSPEYQYLAQQNSPVNSNIFYEGGGLDGNGNGGTDWTSLVQQDNSINVSNLGQNNPYLGMNQQNVGTPTGNYIDGLQTEFHRVNPMKYLTMSEPERMRQNELRQEARIERKEARQAENAANNGGNGGSGVNWGGVIGAAATNVANSLTDPNATTAQKVANALGAPEMAKIWSADWDKANTQIKGMQENIASFNNKNYIQDSNDIQGAGAGLKLNNKPLTLLNTNPQKNLTWKDFRGNMFLKGAKATLQGAASGSVGGPWGALGGAVVGALGSLFGGIGAKKRAKRAKREYDRMLADYNAYGLQQNAKAIMERDLSNQNLLSNGLKQQNISEMSNFRAYGGNLYNTKAMGGQFDMSLSPNMMNLWNDKQNIDRQKIMNQQMNFGLGNSFNQKLNTFDYGGAMNGMDLPTDMQYYENGGTHEQNPNGGVQVGVDQQGNPNLVEEGEFRWGDYIFSDRIPVDYSILIDFNAWKNKDSRNTKNNPTYAELAKKTADKYKDLNDEISKNSLNKQLGRLQQSQEAQKFKEQQDQQYADYTSALKSPTQDNPMYGSMKYNGMGNTNQGVNAGVDEGMGNPMDNSDLSNVNRSGNPMMAAYGGNLFGDGGRPVLNGKIFPTKINPYGDPQLGIIDANNDINGYGLPIAGTQYLTYTGLVDYPTRDNNEPSIYDLNPPKTQNLGDASAHGYNTATKDDYNKLNIDVPFNPSGMVGNIGYSQLPFNRPELAGVNTNFNPITNPTTAQKQQLLVNNGYDLGNTGFYGNGVDNVWGKKSQEAWDDFTKNKYGSTQGNQNQTSPNGSKYNYQSGSYKVKEQGVDKEGLNDYNEKYKPSDGVGVASEQNGNNFMNPQRPQESRGDVDLKNAEVVGSTPYNRPMYNDSGIWANLGKGIAPNLMNWANRANWKFDPDWKPEAKLEALGKTAYRERIADHLGDYVAPNLMDVERLNNAAMAQTAANARGIANIGGGNRGFAAAQMAANDYNGQMGIGNNYVTTNQYNADQLFKSADFNRATNQFNATANNEAWRDNLNSWLQGKNMEINALVQANQARNQKAEYKDRVDREAALKRSSDLGVMTDNMISTVVDEARFNRDLNIANQDRSSRYWYDKKKGSMYDAANTDYEDSMRNLMNGKYVDSEAWNQLNALNKEYGFDSKANKDKLKAAENIINQSQERYNNKQDLLKKEKAETLKNDYDYALNNYNVMRNDPEFMEYMGKALGQGKLGAFSDLYDSDISEQELRRYMDDVNRLYSYYNSYGNRPSENAAKAYGGKLKTRKRDYSLSLS